MKTSLDRFRRPLLVLYPCLLIGILHFCYHRVGGEKKQLELIVFGISMIYFLLICFYEYYEEKQDKFVASYKGSILIAICILVSLGLDIYFHGSCDWMDGLILFLFTSCIAVLLWEGKERSNMSKKREQEQNSNKKTDLLYRDKFLNGMHRRIREIAKIRNDGITIGVVGSWGVGKTYMIDMLCDRLCKKLRKGKQTENGYNRAFKICAPVELWQAASLDDAWNRVIYSLHTCILGKPPFTQTKFWRMLFNLAGVNEVAKQIFEIVEPEFEDFNRDAIEKYIGDSRVVLIFDDLERAKFEIVQAMLPLLERLKKIPHLIVICALAEDELCELMQRNKVKPECTYGYLTKLFDLRIEIPEMGEDAVKNYLKLLFETKHKGCRLTESFFECHQIQFDNPRQMDRIVDKLTSIESQYFPDFHKELDFGNYSMAFDQTSTQVLYIYVVEALRILSPRALYELTEDYGKKGGEIPSRFLKDSISFIITSMTEDQQLSKEEQEWVRKHPQAYKERLKGQAFFSFLSIICDPENHHNSDEKRELFMSAFRGAYKRNTALSGIEAGIIMKKNMKKTLAFSQQIQSFYEERNEKYETSFFEGNVRALLQYVLEGSHEKEDEYWRYLATSLEMQRKFSPKVENIYSSLDFVRLIIDYMGMKESDDVKDCDLVRFRTRETVLINLYALMLLGDQAHVLSVFFYRIRRGEEKDSDETRLGRKMDFISLKEDYKNFIRKLCPIYGGCLYQAIEEEKFKPTPHEPRYNDYNAYKVAEQEYIEAIQQGLARKIDQAENLKPFYISWLSFLGTRYENSSIISDNLSSYATKATASVARFIRDKIRKTKDDFYSTLSHEERNKALEQCNESINALVEDKKAWESSGTEAKEEHVNGIGELLSILEEEKSEIEKYHEKKHMR